MHNNNNNKNKDTKKRNRTIGKTEMRTVPTMIMIMILPTMLEFINNYANKCAPISTG